MTEIAAPTTFAIRPVTSVIGAEIEGLDLSQPLDEQAVAEVGDALVRWKVLFFRGQRITADQQIAFASAFGPVTPGHPVHASLDEHPEVYSVDATQLKNAKRNTAERSVLAPPRFTQTGWHTDVTFVPNPPLGSVLRGAAIPPYGGDTMWANLVAAYEDLSAPIRELIDGLQAVHRWHDYDGVAARADLDPDAPPPSAVHPVVRVHPVSGERSLFVNPGFTRYLLGLSDRENRQILDLLYGQMARPEFTVRFRWEPDSIAFWDNRSTAHVGPLDLVTTDFEREVQRVTIAGDLPVGPDGFTSRAISGDLFV